MVIEFAAGICVIAAVTFAGLWWRGQTGWREAIVARDAAEEGRAGMAAILGTLPLAVFCWRRDSGEIALGRLPGGDAGVSYAGFLAGIETAERFLKHNVESPCTSQSLRSANEACFIPTSGSRLLTSCLVPLSAASTPSIPRCLQTI